MKSFDEVLDKIKMLMSGDDLKNEKREEISNLICEHKGSASERVFEVANGYYNFGRWQRV